MPVAEFVRIRTRRMIPRQQIDIGWSDLTFALAACLRPHDAARLADQIDSQWQAGGTSLTTLSVRSGFDAVLTALDWPPHSEVLVSAATIRDMPRILVEHQLSVVPVDLDMSTLSVSQQT